MFTRLNIMVNEFKVIKVINESTLRLLKNKGLNYDKNLKIKELLKDEAFFFKVNKDKACKILILVGVHQEQLEDVYEKLISPNMFYDLLYRGIINCDDNSLIIKYDNNRI